VLAFWPGAAPAQSPSSQELENRIRRLENELSTLNRAIYRGETVPRPSALEGDVQARADSTIRVQQLEEEVRRLTGKLEEEQFERRQLEKKVERILNDVQMRVGDLETGGNANDRPIRDAEPEPAGSQPNTVKTLGTISQSSDESAAAPENNTQDGDDDDAAAAYENAFALLKKGKYDRAEQAFDRFIQRHPDHVLVGNAQYWLGETFYVRGDYERAARIFAEGYQEFPEGAKAADNLLKLGMSLAGLGNTEDACIALGQIEKDFDRNSGPVLRRARQEMDRLGCP